MTDSRPAPASDPRSMHVERGELLCRSLQRFRRVVARLADGERREHLRQRKGRRDRMEKRGALRRREQCVLRERHQRRSPAVGQGHDAHLPGRRITRCVDDGARVGPDARNEEHVPLRRVPDRVNAGARDAVEQRGTVAEERKDVVQVPRHRVARTQTQAINPARVVQRFRCRDQRLDCPRLRQRRDLTRQRAGHLAASARSPLSFWVVTCSLALPANPFRLRGSRRRGAHASNHSPPAPAASRSVSWSRAGAPPGAPAPASKAARRRGDSRARSARPTAVASAWFRGIGRSGRKSTRESWARRESHGKRAGLQQLFHFAVARFGCFTHTSGMNSPGSGGHAASTVLAVAPNGCRRTRRDHLALALTPGELARAVWSRN